MARPTAARASGVSLALDVLNYSLLTLLGIVTLGPFIYLVLGSLTTTEYYNLVGVSLNPSHWTLSAYQVLLDGSSRIYQALRVTVFITVVGTALSLLATAGLAYGLSVKEVPGRNLLVFYVFFTMLFGGGMIPFYVVVRGLGMVNTLWSLMIPTLISAWYMFIMMKFFESLPADLQDAARIDGCSELSIFWRIVLPLSQPVLATIGLFYAVGRWNEWFWATVFLSEPHLYPLQLVLRAILSNLLPVTDVQAGVEQAKLASQMPPVEVLRMGAIVVTVLPIALVYPFLQRYFVKGVMIGAIKG